MLKDFMNFGKKKKPINPLKEHFAKSVPAQRFNDMISYYTAELKSRLEEIKRLKEENEMLIKTSLKNASRSDELRIQIKKLEENLRMLQQKSDGK